MRAASPEPALPARVGLFERRPRAAADEQLVERVRGGDHRAFEVIYERYGSGILAFCRHMLGSPEEAEDAVQHSFAAAYRALTDGDRHIALKPWLYTIARNRCLSVLRSRRETVAIEDELPTVGLDEQVQRRAELRELLHDIRELPEQQRAALLLTELGAMSHEEVATVLRCDPPAVKGLVFRARSGLMHRRDAREAPCVEIREQLATVRGSSLRRRQLRDHLRSCEACRDFAEQLQRQQSMLAVALPVAASPALHAKVLAATGAGTGAGTGAAGGGGTGAAGAGGAGGGAAAGGGAGGGALAGGAAALGGASAAAGAVGGLGAAPAAASGLGMGLVAKLLMGATLLGGGLAVTRAAVHHEPSQRPSSSSQAESTRGGESGTRSSQQGSSGDTAREAARSRAGSEPGATQAKGSQAAGGAAADAAGQGGAVRRALGELQRQATSGAAPNLPSAPSDLSQVAPRVLGAVPRVPRVAPRVQNELPQTPLGQGGSQPPAKSPLPGQLAPPQVTTPALPKLPVQPPTITAPAPQVNLPKVELPN